MGPEAVLRSPAQQRKKQIDISEVKGPLQNMAQLFQDKSEIQNSRVPSLPTFPPSAAASGDTLSVAGWEDGSCPVPEWVEESIRLAKPSDSEDIGKSTLSGVKPLQRCQAPLQQPALVHYPDKHHQALNHSPCLSQFPFPQRSPSIQICPEHHAVNQTPIPIMKKMDGKEALHTESWEWEADWVAFELSRVVNARAGLRVSLRGSSTPQTNFQML